MMWNLGTALLMAAAAVLVVGHVVLNRPSVPRDADSFGWTEALAFLFTASLSGGLAALVARGLNGEGVMPFIEGAGGVAVALVFGLVLWRGLRRFARQAGDLPAAAEEQNRRGRPDGRPTGGQGTGRRRRAA